MMLLLPRACCSFCITVLLALVSLASFASADPIFGARITHMTVPHGADDPKLSVRYWPYSPDFKAPALSPGQESMVLRDGSSGRKHLCIIPNISAFGVPEEHEDSASQQYQGGVQEGDTRKTPEELLDVMRGLPCSFKMEGWWTYEFCYKDRLRQLHLEPSQPNKFAITMEFVLGVYDAAASKEAQLRYEESLGNLSPEEQNSKKRYHVQVYTGGTPCDLTGIPRRTEVRFFCDDNAQQQQEQQQQQQQQQGQSLNNPGLPSFIKSLKEAPTCVYELQFVSNLLCAHRGFQRVKQPLNTINCYEMKEESEGSAVAEGEGEVQSKGSPEGEGAQVSGRKSEPLGGGTIATPSSEEFLEEEGETEEMEDGEVNALEEDLLQL